MDYSMLEYYTCNELKKLCNDMTLPIRRNKDGMIKEIIVAFKEYEEYKRNKVSRWNRLEQLGNKGKEGIVYEVVDKKGTSYAMKTFRKTKSSVTLKREVTLQERGAKAGISPKIYDYDTVNKTIVMEKMDYHLIHKINDKERSLSVKQQKDIITIYTKLDNIGVLHGDVNLLNYMYKGSKLYMIDYGFAKDINPALIKKLGTDKPNMTLMLLGIIFKLKESGFTDKSYSYLASKLPKDMRISYKI